MNDPIHPALVELVKLLARAVAQEVLVLQEQAKPPVPVTPPEAIALAKAVRSSGRKWLTMRDVTARIGLSRGTINRWSSDGLFPPPTKMGYAIRFWLLDVEKWEAERASKIQKQYRARQQLDNEGLFRDRVRGLAMPKTKPALVNYYTRGEVQKLTGLTEPGIWDAVRSGDLPKCVRPYGNYRRGMGKWDKAEIDALMAKRKKTNKRTW